MTRPDPAGMRALDAGLSPAEAAAQLPPPVRALVLANQALFSGRWDDLAEDLRRRQAGRPYLFKLDLALDEPLAWIGRLRDYEAARGERLADAIPA